MASAQTSGRPAGAGEAGALGLHEGLSHPASLAPEAGARACVCGPAHLRLRSEHGELVRPRGKSVNRCEYCARLAAVENSEMLALDALEGDPPTVLVVLGTRDAFPVIPAACECDALVPAPARPALGRGASDDEVADWLGDTTRAVCERCALSRRQMAPYYDGLRLVKRALKRRWPAVEYCSLLEFTTGYGARSGGKRRPHWNLLLKGVPVDDAQAAGEVAAKAWCRHVDAEVHAQHARAIYELGGLVRYLAHHFAKESQAPPAGFTGQRFNCSRGYFTGCSRATARARAREALALKRELHKQLARDDEHAPADAHEVELCAQLALRRALSTRWVLCSETGVQLTGELLPVAVHDRGELRTAAGGGVVELRRFGGRIWQPPTALDAGALALARRRERREQLLAGAWLPVRELLLFSRGHFDGL